MFFQTQIAAVARQVEISRSDAKRTERGSARARRLNRRTRSRLVRLIAPSCVFIALVSQIWVRMLIIQSGYHLEQQRSSALERDVELRGLRLELARIASPSRLFELAQLRLGMTELPAQAVRTIVVDQ